MKKDLKKCNMFNDNDLEETSEGFDHRGIENVDYCKSNKKEVISCAYTSVDNKINNSDYEFEEDIEDIRKEIIDNLFNEKFPQICFKTDVKVIIKGKQVSIYTGEFYEYSYTLCNKKTKKLYFSYQISTNYKDFVNYNDVKYLKNGIERAVIVSPEIFTTRDEANLDLFCNNLDKYYLYSPILKNMPYVELNKRGLNKDVYENISAIKFCEKYKDDVYSSISNKIVVDYMNNHGMYDCLFAVSWAGFRNRDKDNLYIDAITNSKSGGNVFWYSVKNNCIKVYQSSFKNINDDTIRELATWLAEKFQVNNIPSEEPEVRRLTSLRDEVHSYRNSDGDPCLFDYKVTKEDVVKYLYEKNLFPLDPFMYKIHGKGIKEKDSDLFRSYRFIIDPECDGLYFDYEVVDNIRAVMVDGGMFNETSNRKIEEICNYLDRIYLYKDLKSDLKIYRVPPSVLLHKSPVEFAKETLEEDIK